jgi:hypothetical protein
MSSRKQRAANRANAQNSTAPGAPQGKSAPRYNALKHGIDAPHQIMFDETVADLAGLAAEYHEHHSPADTGQRFLVDTLINNEWRLRRLRRVEAELWEHATNAFLAGNIEAPACSSGDAFDTASGQFVRLQGIVNSCERIYHRAMKALQVRQALPPGNPGPLPPKAKPQAEPSAAAEPTPEPAAALQPEQSKTSSANLASFRQNPKTPASKPPLSGMDQPFAGPTAPSAPETPAESQPSASDPAPKPPQTA